MTKGLGCTCCEPECCCGSKIKFKIVIIGVVNKGEGNPECCENFNIEYLSPVVNADGNCEYTKSWDSGGVDCDGQQIGFAATLKCDDDGEIVLSGSVSDVVAELEPGPPLSPLISPLDAPPPDPEPTTEVLSGEQKFAIGTTCDTLAATLSPTGIEGTFCDWGGASAQLTIVNEDGDPIDIPDFVGVKITISGSGGEACCDSFNGEYEVPFDSVGIDSCAGILIENLECGIEEVSIDIGVALICNPSAPPGETKALSVTINLELPCGFALINDITKFSDDCADLDDTYLRTPTFAGCGDNCGQLTIQVELIQGQAQAQSAKTMYYMWNKPKNKWLKINTNDPEPDPILPPGFYDGQIIQVDA